MKTLTQKLDNSLTELTVLQNELSKTMKAFDSLQQRIPEAVTTFHMYRLMHDIMQGKVLLVHPETMAPVRINWVSSPNIDDEGDYIAPKRTLIPSGYANFKTPSLG